MDVKKFRNKIKAVFSKERGLYLVVGGDEPLILSTSKKQHPLADALVFIEEFQPEIAISIAYGENGSGVTCLTNTAALIAKHPTPAVIFSDDISGVIYCTQFDAIGAGYEIKQGFMEAFRELEDVDFNTTPYDHLLLQFDLVVMEGSLKMLIERIVPTKTELWLKLTESQAAQYGDELTGQGILLVIIPDPPTGRH